MDSSKGRWGVFIQSLIEAQGSQNVFVTMILEQSIDDEHIRYRKLQMLVPASRLKSASSRSAVLDRIRDWIESTEGDGSLDLASQSS